MNEFARIESFAKQLIVPYKEITKIDVYPVGFITKIDFHIHGEDFAQVEFFSICGHIERNFPNQRFLFDIK
jgi:hypothetical protein